MSTDSISVRDSRSVGIARHGSFTSSAKLCPPKLKIPSLKRSHKCLQIIFCMLWRKRDDEWRSLWAMDWKIGRRSSLSFISHNHFKSHVHEVAWCPSVFFPLSLFYFLWSKSHRRLLYHFDQFVGGRTHLCWHRIRFFLEIFSDFLRFLKCWKSNIFDELIELVQ